MSLAKRIKEKWNTPEVPKVAEEKDQWKQDLEKLSKTRTFKEKVVGLSNMYGELKTSDWKYDKDNNADLKQFGKLKWLLDTFDKEIIAVTGKLALFFARWAVKGGDKRTVIIGTLNDTKNIGELDGVDLNSPAIYREITKGGKESVIVFCHYKALFKFAFQYKIEKYMMTWSKDPKMDNMNVFKFDRRYDKVEKMLALKDKKGGNTVLMSQYLKSSRAVSFKEFKKEFEETNTANEFDVFLFGKDIANNTTR